LGKQNWNIIGTAKNKYAATYMCTYELVTDEWHTMMCDGDNIIWGCYGMLENVFWDEILKLIFQMFLKYGLTIKLLVDFFLDFLMCILVPV